MFLELAEEPCLAQQPVDSPYIFIPGMPGEEGVYVREDYFDDLSDVEFEETMAYLEGVQQGMGLFGKFFQKLRDRRIARKEKRQIRKLEKIEAKGAAGTGIAGFVRNITGMFGGGGEPQIIGPGGWPPPIAPVYTTPTPPRAPMNWTPYIVGGLGLAVVWGMTRKRKKK